MMVKADEIKLLAQAIDYAEILLKQGFSIRTATRRAVHCDKFESISRVLLVDLVQKRAIERLAQQVKKAHLN
jgi:hypothetical protein